MGLIERATFGVVHEEWSLSNDGDRSHAQQTQSYMLVKGGISMCVGCVWVDMSVFPPLWGFSN